MSAAIDTETQTLRIEIDLAKLPIFDLMNAVRAHPDAVWVTVFTWADVEEQLDLLREDGEATNVPLIECKQHRRAFEKAIERACMEGGDWTEAVQDVIVAISEEEAV